MASARADSNGAGLVISMEVGWSLILRRADFKSDARFARYYGADVRAEDLRAFLPRWERLAWVRRDADAFYAPEVSARDGEYVANLQGGHLDAEALIEAFRRFMSG